VLGDPGSGKTTLLEQLSGTEEPLLVRNVLSRPASALTGRRLVLDALDEARVAGSADAAAVLAGKLEEAGKPEFVLSCREHDWLGRTDLRAFTDIYGAANLRVCVLQPLTRDDAITIVSAHRPDAEEFLLEAEKRGLSAFLENPNDLLLLIDAVRSGWPSSRRDLFEQAVGILASEANEFRQKRGVDVPEATIIEIAGRLSAAMILSGAEGVTDLASSSDEAVSMTLVEDFPQAQVREILGRRLFRRHPEGLLYRPAHRTVAEYLGGRIIAEQSSDPRKRRRWLNALSPGGRFPPTALRGMYAWAASYVEPQQAEEWFSVDPLGVVLNGDASNFTDDGLRRLLRALVVATERDPYQRIYSFGGRPWAVFAKASLDAQVAAMLLDRETPDALVNGLLLGLDHGQAVMPQSRAACLSILTDPGRSVDRRRDVVETFLHLGGSAREAYEVFDHLAAHRDLDPACRIRIAILEHVPYADLDFVRVGRVVAAVEHTARSSHSLRLHSLVRRFEPADLKVALDSALGELGEDDDEHRPWAGQYEAGSFMQNVLTRMTEDVPSDLTVSRLVALHQVIGDGRDRWLESGSVGEFRTLAKASTEARMLIFKEKVLEGDPKEMWRRYYDAFKLSSLLHMTPAFADALIDLALAEPNKRRAAAIFQVMAAQFPYCAPGSLEVFDRAFNVLWPLKWAPYQTALKFLTQRTIPERVRQGLIRKQRMQEEKESRESLIRAMTSAEAGVRAWNAWYALKLLGWTYYGHIHELAGGKKRLVAFKALFDAPTCDRLIDALIAGEAIAAHPKAATLAKWRKKRQPMHYVADNATMAALELRFASASDDDVDRHLASLTPSHRQSLAVFAVDSTESLRNPYTGEEVEAHGWVGRLALRHPQDFAAGVLHFYFALLESAATHLHGLYFIIREAPFAESAKRILASVATDFPNAPPGVLSEVAIGVAKIMPRADALAVVEAALGAELSDDARARWTAVGFILDPESFDARLRELLRPTGDANLDRARVAIVISTVGGKDHPKDKGHTLTTSQFAVLAETVANAQHALPSRRRRATEEEDRDDDDDVDDGRVRHDSTEQFVEGCVSVIASDASPAATLALERLECLPSLASKGRIIRHYRAQQLRTRIDAEHKPPTPKEAMRLVQDVFPISPADLKIITANVVEDLTKRYRNGDASGYRKFWSLVEASGRLDSISALRDVKPEDDCRDVLLEDLRPELAKCGVKIDAAVGRVNGTEVDLVASYADFAVPVEIKMDDDARLWDTPRDQLAPYAAEPRAGGQGVFVVFWTGRGRGRSVPPPPAGVARPTDASSTRVALISAMPEELRGDIEVVVIDVSKPIVAGRPVAKAKKKGVAKKAAKAKKSTAKITRDARAKRTRKHSSLPKRRHS
jgi:hypothetical protein